ncbi:MAG: hypothetical protein R2827_04880 [Bdellovibrionales bacterium]
MLVPTDMKTLRSNESRQLKTLSGAKNQTLLHFLRPDDVVMQSANFYHELLRIKNDPDQAAVSLSRSSLVIQESDFGQAPQFLDLIAPPVIGEADLAFSPPALIQNLEAVATKVSFLEVEVIESDQADYENVSVLWTQTYEGWLSGLEKPHLKIGLDPNKSYRWQVMFMGQDSSTYDDREQLNLNKITHVTQNAAEISK